MDMNHIYIWKEILVVDVSLRLKIEKKYVTGCVTVQTKAAVLLKKVLLQQRLNYVNSI